MSNLFSLRVIVAGGGIATSAASAQWTMTHLHAIGETSTARGAFGGQQVGFARLSIDSMGPAHAMLWTGSAQSYIDLHSYSQESQARAADDGIQVGAQGDFLNPNRAGYWRGTAASWTELHPAWAKSSCANAAYGGLQGGRVDGHAGIWSGTAESWIDLHPPGPVRSEVLAMHAGQQVGKTTQVVGVSSDRAALWSGTAASHVDLHPAGATWSNATDVHRGVQAGFAFFGAYSRAGIWSGSAGSWTDLHPPIARSSSVNAVYNGVQAGFFHVSGSGSRACLWRGSAASVVDLHPGPPYTHTYAFDITENGPYTIVVGEASWEFSGAEFAVMWTGTTSPCYANCDRSTTAPVLGTNDFVCFLNAFTAGDGYANCDLSTGWPVLTANDFICFANKYVTGCS